MKRVYITGRCKCGKIHRKLVNGTINKSDLEPIQCKCGNIVEYNTIEEHSGPKVKWW